MTTTLPDLPTEGSHDWFAWASAAHAAIQELQGQVAALVAPSGLVFSVNSIAPDASGNVTLAAADVNAMAAGYAPSFSDLPLGVPDYVYKDASTGFWPTGYNADGSPIYTSGSSSAGVRPHARNSPVIWVGASPYPPSVPSGTGGMLQGYDQVAVPTP